MAMSRFMIRKVSFYAAVPLAVRAVAASSYPFTKLVDEHKKKKNFSTVVDPNSEINIIDKHNKILRSRIEELILPREMPPTPANFPFTIEDPDGDFNITLKREIGSEKIEINVGMSEEISSNYYSLDIKVERENGSALKFSLFKASGKELEITYMCVHRAGGTYDYVKELWPDVHEALRKYLEIKYIKDIDFRFLKEYMIINEHNHKLVFLTELKRPFVKGSSKDHVHVDAIAKQEVDEQHKKNFSTVVDPEIKTVENQLNKILRSRLKTAQLFLRAMPPTPANFPFTIEMAMDNKVIILKRQIGSEKVEIKVTMHIDPIAPRLRYMMEEVISGVDSGDDDNHPRKISFKVSKENGSALTFEVKPLEKGYEIEKIIVSSTKKEYNEDSFSVQASWLDMQEALRKYLDIRGLKDIDYIFLKNYRQACVARKKFFVLSQVELFLKGGKDGDAQQDFLEE